MLDVTFIGARSKEEATFLLLAIYIVGFAIILLFCMGISAMLSYLTHHNTRFSDSDSWLNFDPCTHKYVKQSSTEYGDIYKCTRCPKIKYFSVRRFR